MEPLRKDDFNAIALTIKGEVLDLLVIPPEMDKRVAGLASLNVLIGLSMIALPFLRGYSPGDGVVTGHVTLGALLVVLSLFRALLAFRQIWVDGICIVLAGLILAFPWLSHMVWNQQYLMQHVAAGGASILFSLICTVLTVTRRKAA